MKPAIELAMRDLDYVVAVEVMGEPPNAPAPYTANLALAWQVVDEMRRRGYNVTIRQGFTDDSPVFVEFRCFETAERIGVYEAMGSTLGLAYMSTGYRLETGVAMHFWYDFLLSTASFIVDPQHQPFVARVGMTF